MGAITRLTKILDNPFDCLQHGTQDSCSRANYMNKVLYKAILATSSILCAAGCGINDAHRADGHDTLTVRIDKNQLSLTPERSSKPILVSQTTIQCGIVPIKPIVPVECADLRPVCNTATKQWEWSCVRRQRPMQCGIVPIKPIVPVQCKDLIPECDTQSNQWHWLCESR